MLLTLKGSERSTTTANLSSNQEPNQKQYYTLFCTHFLLTAPSELSKKTMQSRDFLMFTIDKAKCGLLDELTAHSASHALKEHVKKHKELS